MLKGGEFLVPSDNTPETFTLDDFNEEQRDMRDLARQFVRERILDPKTVASIENKDHELVLSLLRELGELGFLGIDVPETYGGAGLDKMTSALISEEFGRMGSFACTFGAHTGIGMLPVFFGTKTLKERYLPRLISGEWISAYALTEAGSGSDAGAAKATAVPDGDAFILNGEKTFITNGGFADLFVVFAQLKDVGLTAFLVERGYDGVSSGPEEQKMGIRGSSTTPLILQNVRVPQENILGEPGQGLKIALNILNMGRFKLGVMCLGGARQCLSDALAYARGREQFGRPIIEFGLIREKLAGMSARIAAMEAIIYRTAWFLQDSLKDVKEDDTEGALRAIGKYAIECSIVKVYCSEALWWIAAQNMRLHGGYGYIADYAPERYVRDSGINMIFEGTNEINRLVILDMLIRKTRKRKDGSPAELDLRGVMGGIQKKVPRIFLSGMLHWYMGLKGVSSYEERLNDAKQAVLLGIGAALKRYDKGIVDHQTLIGSMSDCIIDLYVLDSMLAAQATAKNTESKKTQNWSFGLLSADMFPAMRQRVLELLSESVDGVRHVIASGAAQALLPDVPSYREQCIEQLVAGLPE